ncbi:MAG TPA: acyl carrier protein [Thermoanaerobaculia bacterium]|jgi:acyl carrier protein
MKDVLARKLADVAGVAPADLRDDTVLAASDWDSVVVLDVIAAMDEAYDVRLSTATIWNCRTLGDLKSALRSAGADV